MTVFTKESVKQRGDYNMNNNQLPHIHHKPHGAHPHPLHPHERRDMLRVSLDEKDHDALLAVFGDEDSAAAAECIIYEAPPEVQILAVQALSMAEQFIRLSKYQPEQQVKEYPQEAPAFKTQENRARMSCPVLGESAKRLFGQLYSENGDTFYTVLDSAPYEIAVIARILAYLNEKAGEINGHH